MRLQDLPRSRAVKELDHSLRAEHLPRTRKPLRKCLEVMRRRHASKSSFNYDPYYPTFCEGVARSDRTSTLPYRCILKSMLTLWNNIGAEAIPVSVLAEKGSALALAALRVG